MIGKIKLTSTNDNPQLTGPLSDDRVPVGTRIRFTRYLGQCPTEETPAFQFAEKGEMGEVTGHTEAGHPNLSLWPYRVKADSWRHPFFAAREDFEPVAS